MPIDHVRHSEPSIRGVLLAGAGIATTTGIFLVYFLGAFFTWRQVALICAVFPVINIFVAMFVRSSVHSIHGVIKHLL